MKESYREGVANHSGPEPCEGGGNVALEALDRGICRLGIELRNQPVRSGEPTASDGTEGNNASLRHREQDAAPRSRNALSSSCAQDPRHAEKLHAREPGDPVAARGPGGEGDEP